ncbi:glyoxalase [Granulicella sp. 5B5]|uniref:VOC family protein n=1 Tax=Granulicella sp. 5B5 TaxID=1617967 RepID=UPI0015F4768C|nr:VOC family protein [Granulicella sp. 5B5]QMV18368.1 glyoxalase [Granulicella sp. 5B5]
MRRIPSLLVAALATILFGTVYAQQQRPAITGISHMCVLAHDMAASSDFYGRILGATKGPDLQDPAGTRFYFSPTQFVEVLPLPADHVGLSRISCVAFNTVNASALRAYLIAHGVTNASPLKSATDGSHWFITLDPEGNEVQFVQPGHAAVVIDNTKSISHHIIHVGYMVKNRADEDHFYRDLLGFRPYWYGAMQPNHTDWISQQVPNGTDWIEYMMIGDGSDTPANHVDARNLGVLNHFSLGVFNMEATVTKLYQQDRLPPRHDGPQMGRDGKWQANLYDPDGTRVELMEFQPVMKPCCSGFTASSPLR